MTGMHLRQAVVPEMQEATIANFHRRISGEVPSIRYTTIGRYRTGESVHLEVHGSSVLFRGRPAVVGVGINITEQLQQQEELRLSRERLRELAAYINTAREEQRARIARELHDVVGGMLTSMKLDIHRINRRINDSELKEITADLSQLRRKASIRCAAFLRICGLVCLIISICSLPCKAPCWSLPSVLRSNAS
jgi:two-component system sensor histidine kinase UhpB